MNYWNGKIVWITGASSGIGEALAKELAQKGARLILSSRRMEALETLRETLPHSDQHHCVALDVSNAQHLQDTVSTNAELVNNVDVLINNAGISQRSLAWDASPASERLVMETNFFGSVAMAKAVLPGMLKRNSGHIILMSSVTGKFGFPLRSSYAASKHALHGYFESLRAELKDKNIGITLVCPGRIRTNISFNAVTADGSKQNEMDPGLDAGISPQRCAKAIVRAAEANRAEVYIGKEKALIYLNRYFPWLFRKVVKRINPK